MRRTLGAAIGLGVLASACIFGDSPRGAAAELTELAGRSAEATYAAVYRFNFVRQPAPGVATRLEIVQDPPVVVRKVQSSTKREDGKTVDNAYWLVRNEDGDFACNEFEEGGVRCEENPISRTTFGSAKLDIFFDAPRETDAFSSVRKAARPVRIGGHQGNCFEAVPVAASPAPASPTATAQRFRYELCYAPDGILLRGRRTTLDDGGTADNAESFVEVTSLSRVVEPAELRLPGPVVSADDL